LVRRALLVGWVVTVGRMGLMSPAAGDSMGKGPYPLRGELEKRSQDPHFNDIGLQPVDGLWHQVLWGKSVRRELSLYQNDD
jgi:hypothetical protein